MSGSTNAHIPDLQGCPPKKVIQLKFCVVGEASVGIEGVAASKRWVIEIGGAGIQVKICSRFPVGVD